MVLRTSLSRWMTVVGALALAGAARAQSWSQLGPAASEGGEVQALAVDPRHPATVFAGARGVGIFRSDDSGASWVRASAGLTPNVVGELAADLQAATTLWAATDLGLFKTSNNGTTWTEVSTGLTGPAKSLVALALDPTAAGTLYVASNVATVGSLTAAILKTTNGGATWTSLTVPAAATVNTIAIDPATPTTLYVGTGCCGGGFFKSTNGGSSFALSSTGMAVNLSDGGTTNVRLIDLIKVDPTSPSTVYAASALGLYKSTDSAGTWSQVGGGLPSTRLDAFAMDPNVSGTLYASVGATLYKSTDSGATWATTGTGLGPKAIVSLAVSPTLSQRVYGGTRGDGAYFSANGGTSWASAAHGMLAAEVAAIGVDPQVGSSLWVSSTTQTWQSTNTGTSWSALGLPRASSFQFNPSTPATAYAISNGVVMKTTNHGANWATAATGLPDAGVELLAVAPSDPATLYASRCGDTVYKSTDHGSTWTALSGAVTQRCIASLGVDPKNADVVFASAGGGWQNDGVLLTTNGGSSWTELPTGLPANGLPGAIAVGTRAPRTVFLGMRGEPGGLYVTQDDGAHWAASGLKGAIGRVVVDANTGDLYATGVYGGVAVSADQAATWTSLTFDLPSLEIKALAVGRGTTPVFVGTPQGLFALKLSSTDAGVSDAGVTDAGTPDAGTVDAGDPDGGTTNVDGGLGEDAGLTSDGGVSRDGGISTDGGVPPGGIVGGCGCGNEGLAPLLCVLALLMRRRQRQRTSSFTRGCAVQENV